MVDLGLVRWIVGRLFHLPPRQTRKVGLDRDLPVAMPDGVILLADRHFPLDRSPLGTVLMRSPYGKATLFGLMAGLLAERGFATVVQCVRGTMGSGGNFDPLRQEYADGAASIDWLRKQSWFKGPLFTFGPSYLGTAQWAMAAAAGDRLDGMGTLMTLSNFRDHILQGGGFSLAGTLAWAELMQQMTHYVPSRRMRRPKEGSLDHVHNLLPVGAMDEAAFDKPVSWWRDWVQHERADDPWWKPIDYFTAVTTLDAPVMMVGGWQDVFLPHQVRDFQARREAGKPAFLTIGPWVHASMKGMFEGLRLSLEMFTQLARGDQPHDGRLAVRIFLQEAGEWREYPSWPPPEAKAKDLFLRSNGLLSHERPTEAEGADSFLYDPADPTPDVQGPTIMSGNRPRHMAALEQRRDVLIYSTLPLLQDTDVIGPVEVELHARVDREQADFFACLCDVDEKGRSIQVSDGYLRLLPGQFAADEAGVGQIRVTCWPTAWRFRCGHRLRLIVTGGAHPRFARNTGTGEPLSTATGLAPTRQEIFHSNNNASFLRLTLVGDQRTVAAASMEITR